MSDVLLSDRPERHLRVLRLNRPDQLSAIDGELCQALHEALSEIRADRSYRAVVLTGAGRGFCAGVDLRGYGNAPGNDGSDEARDALGRQEAHVAPSPPRARDAAARDRRGQRAGGAGFGLALALACDIRFAARSAAFRVAFMNIGLSNCDMATSWLLPQLIGAARAKSSC
jgi:enoyl-CoA hydratase